MILKKHQVELGTYTICRKGLNSYTLAAPKSWLRYSGAALGDEYTAVTDKRDNSLHFYFNKKVSRTKKRAS